MEMILMHNIYCNLCGKDIKQCTCKRPKPIETKVQTPVETKDAKTDKTK